MIRQAPQPEQPITPPGQYEIEQMRSAMLDFVWYASQAHTAKDREYCMNCAEEIRASLAHLTGEDVAMPECEQRYLVGVTRHMTACSWGYSVCYTINGREHKRRVSGFATPRDAALARDRFIIDNGIDAVLNYQE